MQIPEIITSLIEAQNALDSRAFTFCFTQSASVKDEGKSYNGHTEIHGWILEANQKYNSRMDALDYLGDDHKGELTTEISGTFDGSPIVLKYNFVFKDKLIDSLTISG